MAKLYDWILFLVLTQYGSVEEYLYWDTISKSLSTKAEEQFSYSWDGSYIPPGMKLVIKEIFRVSPGKKGKQIQGRKYYLYHVTKSRNKTLV